MERKFDRKISNNFPSKACNNYNNFWKNLPGSFPSFWIVSYKILSVLQRLPGIQRSDINARKHASKIFQTVISVTTGFRAKTVDIFNQISAPCKRFGLPA